jgi:hypothetical protein
MPVTIEPIEKPAEDISVDLDGPVTFEQYSEALRLFHAEFIAVAVEYGWDKPSSIIRRITLEFPERRNSKVQPAQISPDLTKQMFTPKGWAAFTASTQKEYASRLVLFRKRLLKLASEGYFDALGKRNEEVNRILRAAGLPPYSQPEGTRYRIAAGGRLSFVHENRSEHEVTEEVQAKYAEFYKANGWTLETGYTLPSVSQLRGQMPIPADETAELL